MHSSNSARSIILFVFICSVIVVAIHYLSSERIDNATRAKETVKVLVDHETIKQLSSTDARIISQYGNDTLIEVSASKAAELSGPANTSLKNYPDQNKIKLRNLTIDTSAVTAASVPLELERPDSGYQLHLLHFVGPVKDEWLEMIASIDGLKIVSYVPNDTYLVYTSKEAREDLRALADKGDLIDWEGPYHTFYTIEPSLFQMMPSAKNPVPPKRLIKIQIMYYHKGPSAKDKAYLKFFRDIASGPSRIMDFYTLSGYTEAQNIKHIAMLPDVVNIEPVSTFVALDERQGQIMAGNLNAAGTGPGAPGYRQWLLDKGFTTDPSKYALVNVTDSGLDNGSAASPDHSDFYEVGSYDNPSRITSALTSTTDWNPRDNIGHGTLVSSVVGGYNIASKDEDLYSYGLGVNPFGRMSSMKIMDSGPFSTSVPLVSALVASAEAEASRIINNSWGSDFPFLLGAYTGEAFAYDTLVRDADPITAGHQPMTIIFAAGNTYDAGITPPATAKNVITVGASENNKQGVTNPTLADNIRDVASFSSRGPTDDGRTKPDLVAPGTYIQGAAPRHDGYSGAYDPTTMYYNALNGTSFAAPGVSGAASLFYFAYERQYGFEPSPAMVKAYLTNTGRYLAGNRAGGNLPSNTQGFGLIDLGTAFDDASRMVIDQQIVFDETNEEHVLSGYILDASRPFRVSLAWTDAVGVPFADAFVNDLDLEVTLGTNIFKGNRFSGSASVTGGSFDARNNLESVFLPAGTTGNFSIRVKASRISGDGLPGTGDITDQDFALVVYNGSEDTVLDWEKEIGGAFTDKAVDVIVSSNDSVIVAGNMETSPGVRDIVITKYDVNGNVSAGWPFIYNGAASMDDEVTSIAIDPSNNIYFTGSTFNGSNYDMLTVKLSPGGSLLSSAQYNGPDNLNDGAAGIKVDPSSNVYITGHSSEAGTAGDEDYLTIKYSPSLTTSWSARYQDGLNSRATDLDLDENNHIWVSGYRNRGAALPSEYKYDFATVAYSGVSGSVLYERAYDGPGTGSDSDKARDIVIDRSKGRVFITGTTQQIDGTGNFESSNDIATQGWTTDNDNLWTINNNSLLYDYTPTTDSGENVPNKITYDQAGSFYITGMAHTPATGNDLIALKFDPVSPGSLSWSRSFSGPGLGHDAGHDMVIDPAGYVYITGETSNASQGQNMLLLKYTLNGSHVLSRTYTSSGAFDDAGRGIALDSKRDVYIVGDSAGDIKLIKYLSDFPPSTSLTVDPPVPGGSNGWYTSAPTVRLHRNEPGTTYYQFDSTSDAWTASTSISTTLSISQGIHTLYYYSIDATGNTETVIGSKTFKLDDVPPTIPILTSPVSPMITSSRPTFSWSAATDSSSGIAYYEVQIMRQTGPFTFWDTVGSTEATTLTYPSGRTALANGTRSWRVTAEDKSGRNSFSAAGTFTVDAMPPLQPRDIVVGITNNSCFNMRWHPTTDPWPGSGVSYYIVYANNNFFAYRGPSETYNGWFVAAICSNSNVYMNVVAVDLMGNVSATSDTASFTPGTPGRTRPGSNVIVAPASGLSTTFNSSKQTGKLRDLRPDKGRAPGHDNVNILNLPQLEYMPNISMRFENVMTEGITYAESRPAENISLNGDPYQTIEYYEIWTESEYDGSIDISIDYNTDYDASGVKMLHYSNGAWNDITSTNDATDKIVTGSTQSLSPIAVVEPIVALPTTGPDRQIEVPLGASLLILGCWLLFLNIRSRMRKESRDH